MALLKRRSPLVLAALVVGLGTVVAIVIVVLGVFHDDSRTSAQRLTELCRPVATAVTHSDPAEMTVRDMLRLRQETQSIADHLGEVIKDSGGDVRTRLRQLRNGFYLASDRDGTLPIAQRADVLGQIEVRAGAIGADCPSPLTVEQGRIVDETLGPRTK